jgi:hypothetical protein
VSHYNFANRSIRVVIDLLGVLWLLQRPIRYEVVVDAAPASSAPHLMVDSLFANTAMAQEAA